MGICLAICSGKGGVGKSSVTAALAEAFSLCEKSVAAVDLNVGFRCLDLLFGVDDRVVFDINDVLCGRDISDATYPAAECGASVIPAPSAPVSLDFDRLCEVLHLLSSRFDVLLLDLPSGINNSLMSAAASQNAEFICVSTPDAVSLKNTASLASQLPPECKRSRLVINRFEYELSKNGINPNIDDMIDITGMQLLGIIPECSDFTLLPIKHKIKNGGRAAGAAMRIAKRLCDIPCPLPNPKKL